MRYFTISILIICCSCISISISNDMQLPDNCTIASKIGIFETKSEVSVICNRLEENSFTETIQQVNGSRIKILNLSNSHFIYLPHEAFNSTEFDTLILDNFELDLVSEPDLESPTNENKKFRGILNNVVTIEVRNSKTVYGWNWKDFGELEKLENLIIEDSDLIFINKSLMRIAKNELRFLSLRNSQLTWVSAHSFHKAGRLEWLDLSHNNLVKLDQHQFTSNTTAWKKLWYLDLSFNQLKTLNPDLFARFTNLTELHLENNQLQELPSEIFSPIWDSLTELWISDNHLKCECVSDTTDKCWCWWLKLETRSKGPKFWSNAQCESTAHGVNVTLAALAKKEDFVNKCKPYSPWNRLFVEVPLIV